MSTTTFNSEKKKALVPKLRFSGFVGEWKEILLEDFATRGSGHTPSKSHPEYYNGDINWISLTDSKRLDNGYIEFTNTKITQLGLDNSSAVLHLAGSVLLSRDAGVGKSAVMKHSMAVSQHFIVWTAKENVSSNWFLYNVLQILKPEFERIAIGNTIKTIGLPYFKKLKITAPAFEEQQKIASFLSAVDEKIQQLSRKKELLEQYKKGVMQQLFSGKLRFKDENGKDYPDWEKVKLHNLCDYKNGGSFENYVCDDGEYNLISLNSIDINGKIKKQHKKVSITDNSLKKGDLIMVLSDVAFGNFLGLTDIVPGDNFVLNQRMGALKPIKDFNSFYLKTFINFNQNYFKVKGQGSSQQNLSKGDIINFTVKLPFIEEQQKIAHFLSGIDGKIEQVNGELVKTQEFKKGLLQQMFV